MCKNRGSYEEVRIDIIQPIRDRPEDVQVRIRMEEFIDGLLPEPDVTRGRTRPRTATAREIAAAERYDWVDADDPDLPAPPKPDWA